MKPPKILRYQITIKRTTSLTEAENHIAVLQETSIRRVWHNDEWWFALSDVIVVLPDSTDPRQYIKKMRSRDPALDANWGTTCTPLALMAPDSKMRATNCANTEGLFRIIQSIPSPKAEPFKRWLAQVGYERVKEIENPELANARARELYQAKGYPLAWPRATNPPRAAATTLQSPLSSSPRVRQFARTSAPARPAGRCR